MAERKGGAAAPETTSTIRNEDWYGRDLSGEVFANVLFIDTDLTETKSQGAAFTDCTFRGVKFNASEHSGSAFTNCTFRRANFFDATFSGCKFVGSMFDACAHDAMKVSGGDWSFVGLPGATLRSASFDGVRMREADLTGARCEGGSLRDCDLSGAWLHSADLGRCDLRGSDLTALDPSTVVLKNAVVDYNQAVVIAIGLGLDVRPE